jgi:hypothetical protein
VEELFRKTGEAVAYYGPDGRKRTSRIIIPGGSYLHGSIRIGHLSHWIEKEQSARIGLCTGFAGIIRHPLDHTFMPCMGYKEPRIHP